MRLKLSLLFLVFTSVCFMSIANGAEIYGKANLSITNSDDNGSGQWNLNSNASRLGIKGTNSIGDDLEVIYQVEYEICIDDGDCKGQSFKQRNSFVGIKSQYGTLFIGKHDTPTKLAQKKIDLFNDLEGDIKNTFEGENRVSNIIIYRTPNFSNFTSMVAFVPGEGSDLTGDGSTDSSINDGISYSINYEKDDLYLSISGDKDIDKKDLTRLVSQYKIGNFQIGLMYQDTDDNVDFNNETGFFGSLSYKASSKTSIKAQFGSLDGDTHDEDTFSIGADYKFAKNTKMFAFYTQNEDTMSDSEKDEFSSLGIGLEHKF